MKADEEKRYMKVDVDAINAQLEMLIERKTDVTLEEIPEYLKPDFSKFMYGKTVVKRGETIFYYYHDFINWIKKLYER